MLCFLLIPGIKTYTLYGSDFRIPSSAFVDLTDFIAFIGSRDFITERKLELQSQNVRKLEFQSKSCCRDVSFL